MTGSVLVFWCPSCGYQHPERFNVPAAAVPECPKCQRQLRWVKGFPEEVERFLKDVKESPDNRRRYPSSDYWG